MDGDTGVGQLDPSLPQVNPSKSLHMIALKSRVLLFALALLAMGAGVTGAGCTKKPLPRVKVVTSAKKYSDNSPSITRRKKKQIPPEILSQMKKAGLNIKTLKKDGYKGVINKDKIAATAIMGAISRFATKYNIDSSGIKIFIMREKSSDKVIVVVIGHPDFKKEKKAKFAHPKNGPVNMWHPGHFGQLKRAVVFLPGYRKENYDYWNYFELPKQFKSSGIPALFTSLETIHGNSDGKKRWNGDLNSAMGFAASKSKVDLDPNHQTTVIAHSSGYLEVDKILKREDEKQPNKIILFDCVPASKQSINRLFHWLAVPGNELIVVSTKKREKFHAQILSIFKQDTSFYEGIPGSLDKERKITHIITKIKHHRMPKLLTEKILELTH